MNLKNISLFLLCFVSCQIQSMEDIQEQNTQEKQEKSLIQFIENPTLKFMSAYAAAKNNLDITSLPEEIQSLVKNIKKIIINRLRLGKANYTYKDNKRYTKNQQILLLNIINNPNYNFRLKLHEYFESYQAKEEYFIKTDNIDRAMSVFPDLRTHRDAQALYNYAINTGLNHIVKSILASKMCYAEIDNLIIAVKKRNISLVRILLEAGAKPVSGPTSALFVAKDRGFTEILRLMIDHMLTNMSESKKEELFKSVEQPSLKFISAYNVIKNNSNISSLPYDIQEYIWQVKEVIASLYPIMSDETDLKKILLNILNNPDYNLKSNLEKFNIYNAVVITEYFNDAIRARLVPVVNVFLSIGIDQKTISEALFAASYQSSKDCSITTIVKMLLAYGADVNFRRYNFSEIPLNKAISKQNKDIVQLLLEAGANTKTIIYEGETALDIALKNKNKEITRLIIDRLLEQMPESEKEEVFKSLKVTEELSLKLIAAYNIIKSKADISALPIELQEYIWLVKELLAKKYIESHKKLVLDFNRRFIFNLN